MSGSTPSANLLSGGLDEVFTRTDSSGVADFIRNGIGSTAALTDSTGSIEQTYTYDPFGATSTNGGSANSYQYIGRETDATGLYYFRARYYDPAIDRFISEDPIGLAGGVNVYAYAYDEPSDLLDPFGLKPKDPGPPCGNLGVNCQPPPKKCGGGNAPNDPNGNLGMNALAPAMEAQEHLEFIVTNDILIPGAMIGTGLTVAVGAVAATVGSCTIIPGGGCAVGIVTVPVAVAGLGLAAEGGYYGVTHRFFVPGQPSGPGTPWLPPSPGQGCTQ